MERTDFIASSMLGLFVASIALGAAIACLATQRYRRFRWSRANAAAALACPSCAKPRTLRLAGPLSILSVLVVGGAFGVCAFSIEAMDTMLSSAWKSGTHVFARNVWFAAWAVFAFPGLALYSISRVEPRCASCVRPRWCETCRKMQPTIHTHPVA